MSVRNISSESEYHSIISSSGQRLVVADFFATCNEPKIKFEATRCGPCNAIAVPYENLAKKYARGATFLKIDVDKLGSLSQSEGVTAMPTIKIFQKGSCVGTVQGANLMEVESIIMKYYKDVSSFSGAGNKLGGDNGEEVSSYGVTNLIYSLFSGFSSGQTAVPEKQELLNEGKEGEEEEEEEEEEEGDFEVKDCQIQIRLWDRSIIKETFPSNTKLSTILDQVKQIKGAPDTLFLTTLMPRRVYKGSMLNKSLHFHNLVGQVQFVVSTNP